MKIKHDLMGVFVMILKVYKLDFCFFCLLLYIYNSQPVYLLIHKVYLSIIV